MKRIVFAVFLALLSSENIIADVVVNYWTITAIYISENEIAIQYKGKRYVITEEQLNEINSGADIIITEKSP